MVYDLSLTSFEITLIQPLSILSDEAAGLSFVERSINSTESMNKIS
jgi:hypothetical protein